MNRTIHSCPSCGAPLKVTRFATIVVCSFCNATVVVDRSTVFARKYHDAWAEWNNTPGGEHHYSIGDTHWVGGRLLARGETSDVYVARRARWPSELVLLKIVRDSADAPLLEQEWSALNQLQSIAAERSVDLGDRVPAPVVTGVLKGSRDGRHASAYRWAGGFVHTFEMVRSAYPDGVVLAASIWVWRRILEVLALMHQGGLVHGAILPNHLLIEHGEHGVRLVGFSCADKPNAPLLAVSTEFEGFYPDSVRDSQRLTAAGDLVMSARCVSYLLGSRDGDVPDRVPRRLAALLRRVGEEGEHADLDPWKLHAELGEMGKALFGPPAFHPIVME